MTNLIEKRLDTVRLTKNQKKVMTRIVSALDGDNPAQAAREASKGRSMLAARDILISLKLITADDREAAVTEEGEKIMRDQNLIDDMGELTDEGNTFAFDEQSPVKESLLKDINDKI